MTREAIILAGGRGTRLAAEVPDCPKALAEVAGRPFLDWQLEYLATQPIERIVVAVGYLADAIMDRYGDRFARLALDYAVEPEPLGTGGAVRNAFERIEGSAAYVLNGDTLATVDLEGLHGNHAESITVAVREVADTVTFGSVQLADGRITGFGEKRESGRGFVNAGLYWIHRRLLERWPLREPFSLERDVLEKQVATLAPRAISIDVPFLDMGTPERYAAAQSDVPLMLARHRARRTG